MPMKKIVFLGANAKAKTEIIHAIVKLPFSSESKGTQPYVLDKDYLLINTTFLSRIENTLIQNAHKLFFVYNGDEDFESLEQQNYIQKSLYQYQGYEVYFIVLNKSAAELEALQKIFSSIAKQPILGGHEKNLCVRTINYIPHDQQAINQIFYGIYASELEWLNKLINLSEGYKLDLTPYYEEDPGPWNPERINLKLNFIDKVLEIYYAQPNSYLVDAVASALALYKETTEELLKGKKLISLLQQILNNPGKEKALDATDITRSHYPYLFGEERDADLLQRMSSYKTKLTSQMHANFPFFHKSRKATKIAFIEEVENEHKYYQGRYSLADVVSSTLQTFPKKPEVEAGKQMDALIQEAVGNVSPRRSQ